MVFLIIFISLKFPRIEFSSIILCYTHKQTEGFIRVDTAAVPEIPNL